jgi:hypothetical protein
MLWLSEVMLQGYDIESFEQLKAVIGERARSGELFFPHGCQTPIPGYTRGLGRPPRGGIFRRAAALKQLQVARHVLE